MSSIGALTPVDLFHLEQKAIKETIEKKEILHLIKEFEHLRDILVRINEVVDTPKFAEYVEGDEEPEGEFPDVGDIVAIFSQMKDILEEANIS